MWSSIGHLYAHENLYLSPDLIHSWPTQSDYLGSPAAVAWQRQDFIEMALN